MLCCVVLNIAYAHFLAKITYAHLNLCNMHNVCLKWKRGYSTGHFRFHYGAKYDYVVKVADENLDWIFYQILGRALGGKVTRSPTGWDIGVRTVTFSSSSSLALSSLKIPSRLSIIECHRDEVCDPFFEL